MELRRATFPDTAPAALADCQVIAILRRCSVGHRALPTSRCCKRSAQRWTPWRATIHDHWLGEPKEPTPEQVAMAARNFLKLGRAMTME